MTLANKITILRILMIPVFAWVLLDYASDFNDGVIREWQRWVAFGIFALASVSDAVDGFIARRYNQKSELGHYLDPLADKCLLVTALILLSINHGNAFRQLPLWFPVLVISRDVMLLLGSVLIHMIVGKTLPRPRFAGKCATFFQMVTLGWVLLKIEQPPYGWPLVGAGIFTFISGVWYIFDGVRTLNTGESSRP